MKDNFMLTCEILDVKIIYFRFVSNELVSILQILRQLLDPNIRLLRRFLSLIITKIHICVEIHVRQSVSLEIC